VIKKYYSDLKREFREYDRAKLSKDLMAGVTVAAVALPLALAFGVSSGADAAAGLITAIIAGIVIGLLSGSSYQISGPTGAMSVILVTIAARFGLQGVFLATLLAGILLVIAGIFKVGRVVSVIPTSVITGFTSGIAVIIALGQIDNFFGTVSVGETAIQKLLSYFTIGFAPSVLTILTGLIVIFIMILWPKRWQQVFPSSLAAILIVTLLNSFIFKWDIPLVGTIPSTLLPENRLFLGDIDISTLTGVITPAFSIAALCMVESLLCGVSAGRMKGEHMDADRELVAQGIGNIIIPFFGGIPATAAIARTSVAVKAGQQTRLTSIFHSLGLLLSMFLLAPFMSQIPMAALAGVLMVTAWRMNEWVTIKYLFKSGMKVACLEFLITLVATIVFDLTIAILVGIAFCSLMFTIKVSGTAEVTISKIDPERLKRDNMQFHDSYERVRVAYIVGSLFFGSAGSVRERLDYALKDADVLILSMRGVSAIDFTGTHTLLEFCKNAKKKNIKLYFTGVQHQVSDYLEKGGVISYMGKDAFLWSTTDALAKISEQSGFVTEQAGS